MSERSWFVASDGKQEGPFPESQIGSLIGAGRLNRDTLVWTEGMTDWQRAGDVPGFVFSARPSPPPPFPPSRQFSPLPGGSFAPAADSGGGAIIADFGVWSLLGHVLLATIGLLLVIPAPWAMTWYYRWLVSQLRIPTVPAHGFAGQAGDIWWVFVLSGLFVYLGGVHHWYVALAVAVANIVLSWITLRWVVAKITSQGQPLPWHFAGSVWGYLGWVVLLELSIITIIGWAWVGAAWMRWVARNIVDPTRSVVFNASGLEILWRTLVFVLGVCFIIPIPWVLHWYARWAISQFSIAGTQA